MSFFMTDAKHLSLPAANGGNQANKNPEIVITKIDQIPLVSCYDSEIEWLIESMIPLGAVTMLSAESGEGKTWVSTAIGYAVSEGTPFLGLAVKQRPVVYFDGENPHAIVKRNLKGLGATQTDNFKIWGGWNEPEPPGPNTTNFGLVEYVKEHKPLLIWDSLIRFHDKNEQSSSEMREVMKWFRTLGNLGATVNIIHHSGKGPNASEYRGSSDIVAGVDMAYELIGTPKDGALHRLRMKCYKSRFAPASHFGMEFTEGEGFKAIEIAPATLKSKPSAETVVLEILAGHPPLTLDQKTIIGLAKAKGISKNRVLEFLKNLPAKHGSGTTKFYGLPEVPQELAA